MNCSDVSTFNDNVYMTGGEASHICPDDFRSFREFNSANVDGLAVNDGRRDSFG